VWHVFCVADVMTTTVPHKEYNYEAVHGHAEAKLASFWLLTMKGQVQFRGYVRFVINKVALELLGFWTFSMMEKVQKTSNSVCYAPSSEPFRK
jgi:hypothetical protein